MLDTGVSAGPGVGARDCTVTSLHAALPRSQVSIRIALVPYNIIRIT